ncbi:hypothetical protein G5I_11078 [Acromyrmex echinatior]|uniref:Uncharacterized protein n=1 Tax=Acromyrmex echinatior TaxID=103372 RepID=F4WYM5_ACREC|nr:hypothetical protein G5I_11078 [Acromyrmex echinatior]
MTTITENRDIMVKKNLSEWWSEETEYIFQRIERWAAFARGYNRFRSQSLKQSRWKLSPEEIKINCCGTFNYQSNSKLDNNCLEMHQYDHSIYFKTIGDIRSDKRHQIQNQDDASINVEE